MPLFYNAHSLNDLRKRLKTCVFAAHIPFPDRHAILRGRFVRFIRITGGSSRRYQHQCPCTSSGWH